jgi:hypothetical protein
LQPDGEGHVEHVCDNVIKAQGHESEDGPPHADDFGAEVLCLRAQEAGETDEPVASYASEEDLMQLWDDLLLCGEVLDFFPVGTRVEDAAIWLEKSRQS